MTVDRRGFMATAGAAGVVAMVGCESGGPEFSTEQSRITGLWERWVVGSKRVVDHGPFAALLDSHVLKRSDGVHLFAYGDVSATERAALASYIQDLASFAIDSLDRREQYAYWINLYNALVVHLVLSRYLVLSIRNIRFGVGPFGDGPFERKLVAVLGQPLSLSDIRNRVLRPIFSDPRLHYGLCDAAIGSPNLQPQVFTGERVDRMLDGAALDFVNHPRGARSERGELVLSGIYQWHAMDFGGSPAGVLRHLRRYAAPGLEPDLISGAIVRHEFDWSLNDGTGLPK
jgi:hypothetical protein